MHFAVWTAVSLRSTTANWVSISRDEESSEEDMPFLPRFLLQAIIFAHSPYGGLFSNWPSLQGNLLCRSDWLRFRGISETAQDFHSNLFVPKGQRSHELMMLDTTHSSQPWEGVRGAPLCGPPPRRSLERGGIAVRAAFAACQNGSRCCATSLGRRTRAQRNRSRRKRSTFLWARGPPGLPSAEFHDDGDTCDSLNEYQGLSGYGMAPKDNHIFSPKNVPFDTQRDLRCAKNVSVNLRRCSGAMTGTSLGLHPVNINACPRVLGCPGRAAMLGERNFSSSSGSLCEQKRVCELEEEQWRTDQDESGVRVND